MCIYMKDTKRPQKRAINAAQFEQHVLPVCWGKKKKVLASFSPLSKRTDKKSKKRMFYLISSSVVPEACETPFSSLVLLCNVWDVPRQKSETRRRYNGFVPLRVSAGVQLADSHREEEEGV